MRPDLAKGKSPVDKPKNSFIKELEKKASSKKKDIWEDERPDWSKENSPVVKPSSAKDIRNIEEKKKYGYPTPEWTLRVRNKHKVRWTLFSSAEGLIEKFKYKIHVHAREGSEAKKKFKKWREPLFFTSLPIIHRAFSFPLSHILVKHRQRKMRKMGLKQVLLSLWEGQGTR